MEHSKNYEKVQNYYTLGLWDVERVLNAVDRWITPEEYKEITGFEYPKTK